MSLTFHWFLPTQGDGRGVIGGGHGADENSLMMLQQTTGPTRHATI